MSPVLVGGLALLIGLLVGVLITAARTRLQLPPQQAAPPPAHRDTVLDELRHRYARGEISREEFLQRKIDLEE
ncbi:SHOCT domain-containing protein [Nocardiopsis coralliicola]